MKTAAIQSPSKEKRESDSADNKMKVNKFTEQEKGKGSDSTQTGFAFKKEQLPPPPMSAKSALSEAIGPLPRAKLITITIFFEGTANKLKIPETASVQRAIEEMLKLKTDLHQSSDAYQLRMAEDDGTPDEDFGALSTETPIRNIGRTFCLQLLGGEGKGRSSSVSITQSTKRVLKVHLPGDQYQVRLTFTHSGVGLSPVLSSWLTSRK